MLVRLLEEVQAGVAVAVAVAQLDEIIKQQGTVRVDIVSLLILCKVLITFWDETQDQADELAQAQHQHEKILFKEYLKKGWNGLQSTEIREILPVKHPHRLSSLKVTMTWGSV